MTEWNTGVAKALIGWHLPLAITLLTEQMFSTLSVSSEVERTLYYGHSYTGNALARAAAKASAQLGAAICLAARRHGLLTRPIQNVIVLMPPFCITLSRLRQAVQAVGAAIVKICADKGPA